MQELENWIDGLVLRMDSSRENLRDLDRFLIETHGKKLLFYHAKAAKDGLLTLMPELANEEDALVSTLLEAVISGQSPDEVCALADEKIGEGILDTISVMTAAAVIHIQEGSPAKALHARLDGIAGFKINFQGLSEDNPYAMTQELMDELVKPPK